MCSKLRETVMFYLKKSCSSLLAGFEIIPVVAKQSFTSAFLCPCSRNQHGSIGLNYSTVTVETESIFVLSSTLQGLATGTVTCARVKINNPSFIRILFICSIVIVQIISECLSKKTPTHLSF
jgi:hypothetical protein